jgi:hypothetical protein
MYIGGLGGLAKQRMGSSTTWGRLGDRTRAPEGPTFRRPPGRSARTRRSRDPEGFLMLTPPHFATLPPGQSARAPTCTKRRYPALNGKERHNRAAGRPLLRAPGVSRPGTCASPGGVATGASGGPLVRSLSEITNDTFCTNQTQEMSKPNAGQVQAN